MIDTEVQTLDDAIDIWKAKVNTKRAATTLKQQPPTLKQLFARVKGLQALKNSQRKREKASPRIPLPKLPAAEKREKIRMLYSGGCWGKDLIGQRRLAKRFDVALGQVISWTEDL